MKIETKIEMELRIIVIAFDLIYILLVVISNL